MTTVKTLVYGQVECPEGQVQMCLSRYREIGYIVRWDDGTEWRLVERYSEPIAGGYYCGESCDWFRAKRILPASARPTPETPTADDQPCQCITCIEDRIL